MTLGPKIIGTLIGSALTAAIATASAFHSSSSIASELKAIHEDLGTIKSDVRLLKCDRDFPGDCPGQARRK